MNHSRIMAWLCDTPNGLAVLFMMSMTIVWVGGIGLPLAICFGLARLGILH